MIDESNFEKSYSVLNLGDGYMEDHYTIVSTTV